MNYSCNFCVMDSSSSGFEKYNDGCNYCLGMRDRVNSASSTYNLNHLIDRIRLAGSKREFDCLIGISGGVDSAFVLHKALKLGLRPIVIHIDNGWNSALSQHNIEKLIIGTRVKYEAKVLYWPEYREHLNAMIKANVVDLELLADNIMNKVILETAIRHNIKYILNGVNTATEGIALPSDWAWNKLDGLNLRSILKSHSGSEMREIQPISASKYYLLQKVYGLRNTPFLNYMDYSKKQALLELQNEYNFIPYKYKHYENIFTRFYQGYILPNKFNIDKRKMHLSALIISGEMSKEEATELLKSNPYPSASLLARDRRFVLKKLGLTETFFSNYMVNPGISHFRYKTNIANLKKIKKLLKLEVGFNN